MHEDLRIVKTKEKLYGALGEMMKDSSFDQITVSEIVKNSGITRKTFYNHYQDKFDLIDQYQNELIENIEKQLVFTQQNKDISILQLVKYLNKQDYLLTALLSKNGSLEIQNRFRAVMEDYCKKVFSESIHDSLQLEYQSVLTAGALFSAIQYWLVSGKPISPGKLANTLSSLS